ncbi:CaiB/BaiF CoA-transferase family protein [Calditerricola yamamurae]
MTEHSVQLQTRPSRKGLLSGIRVLDFSRHLPGPFATRRLAEMGAEVVKVEQPGGDPGRHIGPRVGEVGALFAVSHLGKKSICLDLRKKADRDTALRLAAAADVVVESFLPGKMAEWGLDYAAVRAVNPGVVYCSVTGYGQSGEWADRPGHDLNFLAASGLLAALGGPGAPPSVPGLPLADLIGGMAAAEAIVAALVRRERTGEGAHLDIAVTDHLMGLAALPILLAQSGGSEALARFLRGTVCYNVYATRDGRHVALAALEEKFWRAFCEANGRPEWLPHQFAPADPDNPVYRAVAELFAARTRDEWAAFARGVDCCLTPVYAPEETLDGEYATSRRLAVRVMPDGNASARGARAEGTGGGMRMPCTAAGRLVEGREEESGRWPGLHEHAEAVLQAWLAWGNGSAEPEQRATPSARRPG